MTKPIEGLSGDDVIAFREAMRPHLNWILNDEGFKSADHVDEVVAAAEAELDAKVAAAQNWATGTAPGGPGTKSARQFSDDAAAQADLAAANAGAVADAAAAIAPFTGNNVVLSKLVPESGWLEAWTDPVTRRGFLMARKDGALFIPDLRAPWSDNVWDLLPKQIPVESGVLWAISGKGGRAVAACRAFGTEPDGSGQFVADIKIKPWHVSREFDLDLYRVRRQAWQVRPDGIRSVMAPIEQSTSRTGYGWTRFPRALTRAMEGVAAAGLQFRRTHGLNIEGERYVGGWNPAAAGAASLRKIGTVSNTGSYQPGGTWTPSTTASVGDYYDCFLIGGGSVNLVSTWTMYPGDLLVYTGSAWVVQSAPHGGVTRYDGDWWDVTTAGTYNGVPFTVGDKIIAYGGPYYTRYLKLAAGRYTLRGEWSAASGAFPTAYLDQDLWQVTAAGTVGGITFGVDDYLVRKNGAWAKIATTAITTTAANEWVALPVTVSSDEWEVRRSDKSTNIFPVRFTCEMQQSVEPTVSKTVYLYSDSMGRFLSSAFSTALAAEGLSLFVPGYVSAGAEEIIQLIEADIRQGIDLAGQIAVLWYGQNNETATARITAADLRARELLGRYAYLMRISWLGRATVRWDTGLGRFVGLWQEPQKTGDASNGLVQNKAALDAIMPGQWLDSWAAIIAGVTSTLPHLQFPGMNEAQVAAAYGMVPLSYYFDWPAYGVNPALASHKGTWSITGLPSGGAAHDYYRRIVDGPGANEYAGNLLYNVAGVWTEVLSGSPNSVVHLMPTCKGNADLSAAGVSFLKAKKWIKS